MLLISLSFCQYKVYPGITAICAKLQLKPGKNAEEFCIVFAKVGEKKL
jgi:hypothetical protein